MVPRTSYPPTTHHASLTTPLTPHAAQSQLAAFLAQAATQPHLHPDSLLSTTGVTYSAHSGPSGGLAMHHLRRIEAGLRGEDLGVETEEELAQFGDGDDERLDGEIARRQLKEGRKRRRTEEIQGWAEETSSQVGPEGEVESFAQTPEWQDEGLVERQQQQQGGLGEGVVEDGEAGGEVKRASLTEEEKRKRKEAKKRRRAEEKDRGRG